MDAGIIDDEAMRLLYDANEVKRWFKVEKF